MKPIVLACMFAIFMSVFPRTLVAKGLRPMYAKRAVAFPAQCTKPRDFKNCKVVPIPSPDGRSSVQVSYRRENPDRENSILRAFLRVTTPGRGTRETELPAGFQDIDLLWSPDSRAFFLNGGNGGGYWGFWVYVFVVDSEKLEALGIAQIAQKDMVQLFPPCRAVNLYEKECKSVEAGPSDYNMSGIDWVVDSSAV